MTVPPFPTVTRGGVQQWWVIPEGFLGQLANQFTPAGNISGPTMGLFTTVESSTKPPGAVAGPFVTQAQAQAVANQKNTGAVATAPNVANAAASGAFQQITQGIFTQPSFWVRVGEVLAGAILFYVGAKSMFPTAVNSVTAPAKRAVKTAGMAAFL